MKTKQEIEEMFYKAGDMVISGENPYWGMNYVEGVEASLRWVLEEGDSDPPVE